MRESVLGKLFAKSSEHSWSEHLEWLKGYYKWIRCVRNGSIVDGQGHKFTAIILNYKRPQNIDPIVRAVLQVSSVGKVIVSNNNPDCEIDKWLKVRNDKLQIIDQPCEQSPAIRFLIAAREDADYFLAVDDDIFLYATQLDTLCRALVLDPSVPHGIYGQFRSPDGNILGEVRHGGKEVEVDELNRVYAFTREHVKEFYRLLSQMNMLYDDAAWKHGMWDDILLSFSGQAKPLCHDVGPILNCLTHAKPGIAAWRTKRGFVSYREEFYRQVASLKSLPSRFPTNDCGHDP